MRPHAPAATTVAPTSGSGSSATARTRTPPSARDTSWMLWLEVTPNSIARTSTGTSEAAASASARSRTGPSTETPEWRHAIVRSWVSPKPRSITKTRTSLFIATENIGRSHSPPEAAHWLCEGPPMNRLANATSPYLRQHADNPVDWFAWGDEAFEQARSRDVPVFLSIGYAACH